MLVGVPKESYPGENRVALVPGVVVNLTRAKLDVVLEAGAGAAAGYPDSQYVEKGARIAASRDEVFAADVLLQVRVAGANPERGAEDLGRLRQGQVLIGMADPLSHARASAEWAARGVTLFSLELLPRITRAQSMDVLSSMATVSGYRAVLLAAMTLPRMFPMLMTAAGTVSPARVFVIGAGVAGLQAIATAKRLGAVVSGYDVRPAVKEQMLSLGAKFIEMPLETAQAEGKGGYAQQMDEEFYRKQRELMARVVADSDVVITTAAVPGKRSPVLITADMVSKMPSGSVIVDLAAERGGNCELTRADKTVVEHGVTILGPTNLPAEVPFHASQLYAKNVVTFLTYLVKEGQLRLDADDEIVRETMVARGGQIVQARVKELLASASN